MALDHFDKYKLDQIQQDLRRLRFQTTPRDPNAPPPEKGAARRTLALGFGAVMLLIEGLAVTLLLWKYLGSEKGLHMMAGKQAIGGLHWDPFVALVVSIVAGLAWYFVFLVPIIGPVVGVVISAAWGTLAFLASESAGFAIFVFLFSLLVRMSLRISNKRPHWLAALEWGLVVAVSIGLLAPFSPDSKLRGLGLWSELRAMQDNIDCGKELRKGLWKGGYAETPAFYAQRKVCAANMAAARLKP